MVQQERLVCAADDNLAIAYAEQWQGSILRQAINLG
jgi:hypothetical protein